MVAAKIFGLAAFAVGAIASPIATTSKPFNIGVTFADKTLFLTGTTKASTNQADAVACTLNASVIACGANKAGLTYGDFHSFTALAPTVSSPNNKDISIAEDNTLHWKSAMPGKEVHFSVMGKGSNELYAEICSSYQHPDAFMFTPGVAKAYFIN